VRGGPRAVLLETDGFHPTACSSTTSFIPSSSIRSTAARIRADIRREQRLPLCPASMHRAFSSAAGVMPLCGQSDDCLCRIVHCVEDCEERGHAFQEASSALTMISVVTPRAFGADKESRQINPEESCLCRRAQRCVHSAARLSIRNVVDRHAQSQGVRPPEFSATLPPMVQAFWLEGWARSITVFRRALLSSRLTTPRLTTARWLAVSNLQDFIHAGKPRISILCERSLRRSSQCLRRADHGNLVLAGEPHDQRNCSV